MAFSFPLAITVLSDILRIESVTWDVQRSDELDGSGDGRTWQIELAPPLWMADVKLTLAYHADAKKVAAIVRKLQGAQHSFLLVDPLSPYPASDPDGSILGSSTVQVNSIGSDRQSLSLKGLPASFVLTPGDKGQITYSSSPSRNYYFEVSEAITANGSGVTAAFEVFPAVPTAIAANAAVTLKKPACKGFIVPGSFNPGSAANVITSGAAFKFMERR